MDISSLILTALVLVATLAVVSLSMAFGWPTVPSVKSSGPAGYATTMDPNNSSDDLPTLTDASDATDEAPTVVDVPAPKDPTDSCSGGDADGDCAVSVNRRGHRRFGPRLSVLVLGALLVAVAEGDQR